MGSVSYLNAKPLIYGLDSVGDVRLVLDVPSRLLEGLSKGRFELALLPVIDYQRMPGLRIVPASGIGCDGPTLTVRIFSRVPIERIGQLACDTDSHTSVALARILLAEKFGVRPEFRTWSHEHAGTASDALLLIGDKVVCEEPPGFPHQLDLGHEWKELTGLPFVFAVWMSTLDADLGELPRRLQEAKQAGLAHVREIIEAHAIPRGWPREIAIQYLTSYLKYDIGPRQHQAIELFHQYCAKYNLINGPVRPLAISQIDQA